MAPKIKLSYFFVRARGEICRLALEKGGVPYEMEILTFEEWPKRKETFKFGCLPNANIDGVDYAMGMALATYFAKLAKVYPDKEKDQLQCDMIANLREDMLIPETKHFLCGDEKEKAELEKNLVEAHYPKYLQMFENILKDGKGRASGSKFSLGDIIIYEGTTTVSQNHPDLLAKYPLLVKHRKTTEAEKGIKEYLAKRKDPIPM